MSAYHTASTCWQRIVLHSYLGKSCLFCRCSCGGTESDSNSIRGSSFQDVCMLIKFQFFSRSLRTLSSPLITNHQCTTRLGLSLAILYFLLTKTASEGTLPSTFKVPTTPATVACLTVPQIFRAPVTGTRLGCLDCLGSRCVKGEALQLFASVVVLAVCLPLLIFPFLFFLPATTFHGNSLSSQAGGASFAWLSPPSVSVSPIAAP